MPKPILCLDFDGVCHSYTSGWLGAAVILDPPVEGLWRFLLDAAQVFEIAVYSARSHQENGRVAMINWFAKHAPFKGPCTATQEMITWFTNLDPLEGLSLIFPLEKPPALVTLDDRALTFTGEWPSVESLLKFKPWNKQ